MPNAGEKHKDKVPPEPDEDIPTFNVEFKAADPVPGVVTSFAMVTPVQCNGYGATVLDRISDADGRTRILDLIHDGKATPISLDKINDLHHPQYESLFVSKSTLGVMLNAARNNADSSAPEKLSQFIARFDLNGSYLGAIELPFSYPILRFALLSSGDPVVFGFDPYNNVPHLIELDSSGRVTREYPLQTTKKEEAAEQAGADRLDALAATQAAAVAGSEAFGRASFTSWGDRIIFYRPGVDTVLVIGEDGGSREERLTPPKGYALDGFLAANDRWLVQFRRASLLESGHDAVDARPESGNFVLYEVRPGDGSLRRQLKLSGDIGWIACEQDGALTSFKTDDKKRLIPLTAELGK
jgi:hypothetical protein